MIKGIKICGVSDLKTLKYIISHPHPPQFIGFISNFKKSKRYVEFEKLKELLNNDKNGISFVSFEYSKLTKEFYNINKSKKRNVIAWTINSKLEAIKMKNCCDTITFEGFKPI